MSEASKSPPRIENFNRSSRAGSPFIPDRKKFLRPDSYRDGPSPHVSRSTNFVHWRKLLVLVNDLFPSLTKIN